jgi:hypothetical protein
MKPEKLSHLISLYFAGETTLKQEREIYAYFSRADIDPAFERYAPLFRDMAAADGMHIATAPYRIEWRRFIPRAAAAVALVALIGSSSALLYRQHQYNRLVSRYEGSYIIVGGQRTDNIFKIHKQLAHILTEAGRTERQVSQIKSVGEAEQDILSSISNPDIRAAIEQTYNN